MEGIINYFQSGKVPIKKIIDAAETASFGDPENIDTLVEYLESDNPAIRYWGATGLLILGEKAESQLSVLKAAAKDESVSVAVVAAEALFSLGVKKDAFKAFARALQTDREFAQTQALNSIYLINASSDEMKTEVIALLKRMENPDWHKYSYRAAMNLINRWGINVEL